MFLHLLTEPPLGEDANDLPTPDEVRALWEAISSEPVPDYEEVAIRRMFRRDAFG